MSNLQKTPYKKGSPKDSSACVQKILESVKNCKPRSRRYFLFQKIALSLAGFATVFAGSVMFGTLIYRYNAMGLMRYEATHQSLFGFLVDHVPIVWVVLFVCFLVIALWRLRCMPQMYKIRQGFLIAGVIVATMTGGVLVYSSKTTRMLDGAAARMMPRYQSASEELTTRWMHPKNGRLIGYFQNNEFVDVAGTPWFVDTTQILSYKNTCKNGAVKMIGYIPKELPDVLGAGNQGGEQVAPKKFIACDIMPVNKECLIAGLSNKEQELKKRIDQKQDHFKKPMYLQLQKSLQKDGCRSLTR